MRPRWRYPPDGPSPATRLTTRRRLDGAGDQAIVPAPERELRADAQRNLARILEAAREVFAEEGIDARVTEIAARAGVGVGTIFRRFPNKDELIVALLEQRGRQLGESADAALAGDDPGLAFRRLIEQGVEMQIGDRGLCDAIGTDLLARDELRRPVRPRAREARSRSAPRAGGRSRASRRHRRRPALRRARGCARRPDARRHSPGRLAPPPWARARRAPSGGSDAAAPEAADAAPVPGRSLRRPDDRPADHLHSVGLCLATGPSASRSWATPSSAPPPPATPRVAPAPSSAGSSWAA